MATAPTSLNLTMPVQEQAKRLAVEVHDRDGVELQLRVGLNSGQVIAGEIGSRPLSYTAIGEQVGLAQRMESVATPGGVMLSEATAHLVEQKGTVTLVRSAPWKDRWGEHRNGVVQGPPLPGRDHQPLRVAVLSVPAELS